MKQPECIERFKDMYEASIAHTFLFHGATYDYVEGFDALKPYLSSLVTAAGKEVVYYNRSEGITFCTEKGSRLFMSAVASGAAAFPGMSGTQSPLPKEPVAALELLEAALKKNPKEVDSGDNGFRGFSVIIEYADTIFPPGDSLGGEDRTALVTILRWAKDPVIAGLGNMVIMVASAKNRVSAPILEASSRIEPIAVSLPSRQDREKFLKAAKGKYNYKLEKGFSDGEFANLTAGLGRIHVVDIILRAKKDSAPIDKDLIKRRKDEIVLSEYGNVLQIRTPEWGYEAIGGMEYLKDFMRKSVIKPLMEGNPKRTPLGILMCGAPGTGKTALAEATAKEASVNFVILNMARIFDKYVGATERNLERAFEAIESLHPTICLLDEIDQAMSRGGGGDSGVSSRVFKRFLEFSSDTTHRGKVVFLGATNRPDTIDPALKRFGRFDKKIAFMPPAPEERAMILKAVAENKLGIESRLSDDDYKETARLTDKWIGSDLEGAVVKAYETAEDNGRNYILAEDLMSAANTLKPDFSTTEYYTLLALKEVNDLSLLPPQYRKMSQGKIDERIEELRPASRKL